MIRIVRIMALVFVLTLVLVTLFQLYMPQLRAEKFLVFHSPGSDVVYEFYIQDLDRALFVRFTERPCFENFRPEVIVRSLSRIFPERLVDTTGRILVVKVDNNRLFVEDSIWGFRCQF